MNKIEYTSAHFLIKRGMLYGRHCCKNISSIVDLLPLTSLLKQQKNNYKVDKRQYRWTFSLLSLHPFITTREILRYIYFELNL
jgi:hypothetical protein